jgi:hypothetical protein
MRPTDGGAFILPSEVWISPHLLSDAHARTNARQTTKFAARVIWRQTDHRLAVLRSVGVHFARQTSASLLHALRSSKRCRREIQLLRCRCRECARPAAPMIVRCACRRSGGVVDPPSTRTWLRVNEIALVATQMEVVAKRSAACTSAILLARVPCDTAVMARPRKSQPQCVAAPDDLYDYARPLARRPARPAPEDRTTWTVKDDWPADVPVTEAEIEVFEAWFGDLFDDLFSTRH